MSRGLRSRSFSRCRLPARSLAAGMAEGEGRRGSPRPRGRVVRGSRPLGADWGAPGGETRDGAHAQGIVRADSGGRRPRRPRRRRPRSAGGRRAARARSRGARVRPRRCVRPELPLLVRRVPDPDAGRRERPARGASGVRRHVRRRRARVRWRRAPRALHLHLPLSRRGGPRLGTRAALDCSCSDRPAGSNRGPARPGRRGAARLGGGARAGDPEGEAGGRRSELLRHGARSHGRCARRLRSRGRRVAEAPGARGRDRAEPLEAARDPRRRHVHRRRGDRGEAAVARGRRRPSRSLDLPGETLGRHGDRRRRPLRPRRGRGRVGPAPPARGPGGAPACPRRGASPRVEGRAGRGDRRRAPPGRLEGSERRHAAARRLAARRSVGGRRGATPAARSRPSTSAACAAWPARSPQRGRRRPRTRCEPSSRHDGRARTRS